MQRPPPPSPSCAAHRQEHVLVRCCGCHARAAPLQAAQVQLCSHLARRVVKDRLADLPVVGTMRGSISHASSSGGQPAGVRGLGARGAVSPATQRGDHPRSQPSRHTPSCARITKIQTAERLDCHAAAGHRLCAPQHWWSAPQHARHSPVRPHSQCHKIGVGQEPRPPRAAANGCQAPATDSVQYILEAHIVPAPLVAVPRRGWRRRRGRGHHRPARSSCTRA